MKKKIGAFNGHYENNGVNVFVEFYSLNDIPSSGYTQCVILFNNRTNGDIHTVMSWRYHNLEQFFYRLKGNLFLMLIDSQTHGAYLFVLSCFYWIDRDKEVFRIRYWKKIHCPQGRRQARHLFISTDFFDGTLLKDILFKMKVSPRQMMHSCQTFWSIFHSIKCQWKVNFLIIWVMCACVWLDTTFKSCCAQAQSISLNLRHQSDS